MNNTHFILTRVNYYNKLNKTFNLKIIPYSGNQGCDTLKNLNNNLRTTSVYSIDFKNTSKNFKNTNLTSICFGDIRTIQSQPTFTKSRNILLNNRNNVILKLDKNRHFNFISDKTLFKNKKNMLVWRGSHNTGYQENRKIFLEKFTNNNLLNITGDFMTIRGQLKYKFIVSLEGNDVATNLKWLMSSNSVCIMRKPTCETWFMEGTLRANYHYILIEDDYSDLIEKLNYYIKNENQCLSIIKNANNYCKQFMDDDIEDKIGYEVFKKYINLCENNIV